MARHLFPADLFFYEGGSNAVQLGAQAPFRVYTARTGGTDVTADMNHADGVSVLNHNGAGDILADDDGVRPWMMGPDTLADTEITTIYIDAGGTDRHAVYADDALKATLSGSADVLDLVEQFDVGATPTEGDALTWNGTVYVPGAAVSLNVKTYGAVGDWSSGTTGTDDYAAINACLTAAAALVAAGASSVRVVVPWTTGNGYKFGTPIVTPAGVEWDMRAPLVYTGSAGNTALTVGGAAYTTDRARHVIRLRRSSVSSWADEADLGVKLINQRWCNIDLVEVQLFTVGAQLVGNGTVGATGGFVYNTIRIGSLVDNKISLDLDAVASGYVNQNFFHGGGFHSFSATSTNGLDRTAIRITSSDATYSNNNNNVFDGSSFEMRGAAGDGFTSICLDVVRGGMGNRVTNARAEGVALTVVRTANAASPPYFHAIYNSPGVLTATENSSVKGVVIEQETTRLVDSSKRVVFSSGAVHKTACYANAGGTNINVPTLARQQFADADGYARYGANLTINANYLEITSSALLGRFVSLRQMHRLTIVPDSETSFGGRVCIRTYDNTGTIMTTAGLVVAAETGYQPTVTASTWRTPSDSTLPRHFWFDPTVDYVFIGLTGGTANCRTRGFTLLAAESSALPQTWLPWPDYGDNYGTAAPTGGTWEVGRKVHNAAPTASGTEGWICITAGTPGTWKTFGAIGA